MKSLRYLASSATVALLFCASVAFARDNSNSGSFDLGESVHVGSTVLKAGHYKAEWTGPADALKISIVKNGETVATASGTMKELPQKAHATAVTLRNEGNSGEQIEEIQFGNHTDALELSGM